MRTAIAVLLFSAAAFAQPVPAPNCIGSRTKDCSVYADRTGKVTIGATVRAGNLFSPTLAALADLADLQDYSVLTDSFADLTKWTVTGTPTYGTVTAENSVATIAKTATGGNLIVAQKTMWTRPIWPYTVELGMSIDSAGTVQIMLLNQTGAATVSTITFSAGAITHTPEGGSAATVTPTKWAAANVFRLIWWVDPKVKSCQLFMAYKDSDGSDKYTQLVAPFTYSTATYAGGIKVSTGSSMTGNITLQDVGVWGVNTVVIGDSIATGHPGYDPIYSFYGSQDVTSSIAYWLQQSWNGKRHVLDFGHGGDATSHVASRNAAWVIGVKPKTVIYHIGVNDIAGQTTWDGLATARSNLTTAITASLAAGIRVVVDNVGPDTNFDATHQALIPLWNAWLLTTCQTLGCVVADINTPLQDPASADTFFAAYTADGLHPNALGYRLMAREVWKALAQAPPSIQ